MLKIIFRRETMPNELLARLPDMLGKDNGQTYQSNGGQIGRSFTRSPVSPRRLGKQSPEQLLLSDDLFMQKVLDQLEKTVTASSQQWMNRPGGRLGSTTATADDNGDLILLLAEKERQLELAARVGQTLLEKNKDLETKNDFLEENLSKTNEQMTQLRHDLQQRCDLLRVFSNLEEDSLPRDASDESLKRRLETTRRENDRLRQKCDVMRKETEMTIAEEKQRVEILEHQLDDANERVHRLQKQIETKSLELSSQTSTVEGLLKELARKDCRGNQLRMEKEEISEMLNEMMGQHDQKVVELRQMQEQFTALKHQLSETEDELQRSRQRDALRANSFDSLYDSLASEMENSDSGVCSSRGASAAACLSQTHLQPGRAYVGASTMPLMGHHRNIQPLSLELELAEAQSQQPSASSSCHRHHDDSPVQLSETPMAPIHVLCDASTSCTNIALECGFDETDCRPPTPLATSTPLAKKKTEMKLELTEPQSVVLETKQPARTEVAPPPSTTPKRPSTPTKLVLHRSPKKSLAATLYQAMVPAVFGAKRSTSEDSLEDYEAPKMGQPGVPGTRDLDFSVKMFKARQEQFGVESRIRGLIDAAGLNCRTDPSVLFACGPSSSSSSTSSSVRLPPQSVKNPTVYTRYSRFPRSYSTSSTAQESRSPPKSDTGRKSSEGWTDFGAAYGMRLIQGLCTESSSIDGLAQMAGGGGRSSGVLTRTEMSAPQSIGTLSRPIGISLSSTMQPSQPMAGVVQRR